MLVLAIALGACRNDGPTGDDDATGPCSTATVGAGGGELAHGGVVLTVPAGAFAADTDVELCTDGDPGALAPASVVAEVSATTAPLAPLAIAVPYDAPSADSLALWAEDAGGALVRQVRAVETGGAFEAPLYHLGAVLVAPDARRLEAYEPVRNDLVDVLFVVDNSCSTNIVQEKLVDEFPSLLAAFDDGSGRDWHLGVTTTDLDRDYDGSQGKLRVVDGRKWVDPATPDPAAVFAAMALVGTYGSGVEQGLGATYLALDARADAENAGFLRDEAELAVVVVTDEPDGTPANVVTDVEFVDWFDALKPAPDMGSFHAVMDLNLGGAYRDVADDVGGSVLDMFSASWTPLFEDLLARTDAERMVLAEDAAAVEVWVLPADGGEPWPLDPASFTFDGATNRLAVDPGAVAEGDALVVLYVPA